MHPYFQSVVGDIWIRMETSWAYNFICKLMALSGRTMTYRIIKVLWIFLVYLSQIIPILPRVIRHNPLNMLIGLLLG